MTKSLDWRRYVTANGDFELPTFLYNLLTDLMKATLDMGTLLSNDSAKTRAYKEQVKKIFKDRWNSLAQALEYFEIIVPCTCDNSYCSICGGSRYLLNSALSPDTLREIAMVVGPDDDPAIAQKLQQGLQKALREVGEQ